MQADYVIVGAGSAGCILANRLSKNPSTTVALLEAGGSDRDIMIAMPTALSYPMNSKRYNWWYWSEPEPYINHRKIHQARGKVLGGSSSINGMAYVRGHPCDYEQWQQSGAQGWGYQGCLPYFKKLECWYKGADCYRGGAGEVKVNCGNDMRLNPLYQAFIDAGVQAGYGRSDDYNGYRQEGFAPMQMNVDKGVRASAARAFLRPVKQRKNLTVISKTQVSHVLFEGSKAIGVEMIKGGKTSIVSANKEVILCAGAIGSPHLLQLSGIGSPAVLADAGIDIKLDRPGVGENLQDHLEVFFQYQCKLPVSLNRKLNLFSKGLIGLQWLLFKTGLGRSNHFESCAFIRSDKGVQWPDIQYHFLPAAMSYDGNVAFDGDGYQVHVGPNKAKSRGFIRLKSSDWREHPKIQFNYLQQSADVEDWRKVIRLTREILEQPALADYRGAEIQPGRDVQSDDEIDAWVRENVETAYHPSCSCKMGAQNDPMAVVDNQCRVIGAQALRVVDSSIFPTIPNGNLNAPSMMVAEKAADIILGQSPEIDEPAADYWIDENWPYRQRSGQ